MNKRLKYLEKGETLYMNNNNIGCITEQGDLGLGFNLLNEKDQNLYNENTSSKDSSSDKDEK